LVKALGVRIGWRSAFVIVALAAPGCASDPDAPEALPACLTQADVDNCMPLYPAEFPAIFGHTLGVTCATSGASCHGPDGAMGGLILDSEDGAYSALLGQSGQRSRVMPGDPKCSELMVRLDSPGHAWSMPPTVPLDDRARCAIRRWIAAGALRTPPGTAP
jgi:hypothetical protein